MSRLNVQFQDPDYYAQVEAEQRELEAQYSTHITMARICPYCKNKVEILCKGNHGAAYVKCCSCKKQVFFPPVSFRLICCRC